MWLGEQITKSGIGNGISLLITVGILADLPGAVQATYGLFFGPVGAGENLKFVHAWYDRAWGSVLLRDW